jgi:hypothetical protein
MEEKARYGITRLRQMAQVFEPGVAGQTFTSCFSYGVGAKVGASVGVGVQVLEWVFMDGGLVKVMVRRGGFEIGVFGWSR